MPLTPFQRELLALLAHGRSPESYLAGGAALHMRPNSTRFSRDLGLFHDAPEQVSAAFGQDRSALIGEGLHELRK